MWKYRCRNQVLFDLAAFAFGCLLMVFTLNSGVFFETLESVVPEDVLSVIENNQELMVVCGGWICAGIMNVFNIGSLMSMRWPFGNLILLMAVIFLPEAMILFGVVTVPFVLIGEIYGWISLNVSQKNALKAAGFNSEKELGNRLESLVRFDQESKNLGSAARKTMNQISMIYGLALVAMLCVLFFVNQLLIAMILLLVIMFARQYLSQIQLQSFNSISKVLLFDCNPQECLAALLWYGKRKNGYKLGYKALTAQCLIYMNEADLAKAVLVSYNRGTIQNEMTYWSLMSVIDYMNSDRDGLKQCVQKLQSFVPVNGSMGMMVRSDELLAAQNRLNLMDSNFAECKRYFSDLLKRSHSNLQISECDYYIAMISYIQEDNDLARTYFERCIKLGHSLYFTAIARNYLDKLNAETNDDVITVEAIETEPAQEPEDQV